MDSVANFHIRNGAEIHRLNWYVCACVCVCVCKCMSVDVRVLCVCMYFNHYILSNNIYVYERVRESRETLVIVKPMRPIL